MWRFRSVSSRCEPRPSTENAREQIPGHVTGAGIAILSENETVNTGGIPEKPES